MNLKQVVLDLVRLALCDLNWVRWWLSRAQVCPMVHSAFFLNFLLSCFSLLSFSRQTCPRAPPGKNVQEQCQLFILLTFCASVCVGPSTKSYVCPCPVWIRFSTFGTFLYCIMHDPVWCNWHTVSRSENHKDKLYIYWPYSQESFLTALYIEGIDIFLSWKRF